MTNYTIYRLFDYETGLYIGEEFTHIRDFFDYHMEHTFNLYSDKLGWAATMDEFLNPNIIFLSGHPYFADNYSIQRRGIFRERYGIKDAYGKNYFDPQELYRIAYNATLKYHFNYRWFYDYEWNEPKIFKPKNNVNKLKRETWSWFYRGVQTSNEIRQNHGHVNEYGEGIVRAKRRGYNIPTSYDDCPNSRWSTRKNWKHNSKRRHQWKQK